MRIISGIYKGRKLEGYDIEGTRPTMDRVKESLFAMIQNDLKNTIVLDLFAGSGALGIEALSNGARKAYLVEKDKKMSSIIAKNLIGIKNAHIINKDYKEAIKDLEKQSIKVDIVFLDPPYNGTFINDSLKLLNNILADEAIIICEYENENFTYNLKEKKYKEYGNKKIKILGK